LVYAVGVAFLVVRWLMGALRLWRLHHRDRHMPPEVAAMFAEIGGPAGGCARLLQSDEVTLPLTFGRHRPVIVVPECLGREGDKQGLRFCLAHEWSHVERGEIGRW
jgi:beta-lactamase regulating signal transducer with metallopeptidase domain